jgi:type I restriction enzyme S subunit
VSRQRIKYQYRVIDKRAGHDQPPLMTVSIHHGVVRRDTLTDDLPRAEDLSNYKICETGDIVLNRMRAFQGAIGISPQRGLVSPDYLVLRPEPDVDPRCLHHLFRSTWFVGEMVSRLRGIGNTENGAVRTPRINPEDLGDIPVSLPSLDEQRRIADFLDAETARINCAISLIMQQAQVIDERYQAVIDTELGCTEDLIPLKYVTSIVDTEHKTAPRVDDGGYWIAGTAAVRRGRIDQTALYETDLASFREWSRRRRARPGDVLLSREAPVGEVGLYRPEDPQLAIGQRMVLLSPDRRHISSEYLVWTLLSSRTKKFLVDATQGSLHPHLNMSDIGSIPVNNVSLSDQEAAVLRLSSIVGELEALSELRRAQLTLLVERRQALVTDAVTGQIDVTTARGLSPSGGVAV